MTENKVYDFEIIDFEVIRALDFIILKVKVGDCIFTDELSRTAEPARDWSAPLSGLLFEALQTYKPDQGYNFKKYIGIKGKVRGSFYIELRNCKECGNSYEKKLFEVKKWLHKGKLA
jgi:hypothetical protein